MADGFLFYYITDRAQFPGDESVRRQSLLEKIAEATRANIDYIQLREKDLSTRDLERLARDAAAILHQLRTENRELRTKLLVKSRTDIAQDVGADGVHLRSNDVSAMDVRKIWACGADIPIRVPAPVIGVSSHTTVEVLRAESEGADFVVFAPVFGKKAVPAIQPRGLAALREACQAKIPVFALGGVTLENAAQCRAAGAKGIAAIRLFQENRLDDIVRILR